MTWAYDEEAEAMKAVEGDLRELRSIHGDYERCCQRHDRAVRVVAVMRSVGFFVLAAWALGAPWVSIHGRIVIVLFWSVFGFLGNLYVRQCRDTCFRILALRQKQAEDLTESRVRLAYVQVTNVASKQCLR